MNEETLSLIWSRRSIRDFERREIEKETVDKLKAMTLRAPQRREHGDVLYIGSGGPGEEEKTK